METTYRQLTDFLVALGTAEVDHTERKFLPHLIGVYRDLADWGCAEDVCRAGMFHSIYGTQKFQKFALPLDRRDEVCALIGQRAERLAWINCVMDRASFDRAVLTHADRYVVIDRTTSQPIELAADDFEDLCRVHLADWLEQVPHSKQWDYRRQSYRNLAERLGGVAIASHAKTYALEDAGVPSSSA